MPGLPNPWVILGIVLAWIASLVAVGWWQREDGATAERVAWETRENANLRTAQARIAELEAAAKRDHRQHELSLAAIGGELAKEKAANEDLRRYDRRRALAGDIRLRFNTTADSTCARGADGASPAAGGGDGPATAELPREIAADLLELANDADEVVRQLTACQRVVESDRVARH